MVQRNVLLCLCLAHGSLLWAALFADCEVCPKMRKGGKPTIIHFTMIPPPSTPSASAELHSKSQF